MASDEPLPDGFVVFTGQRFGSGVVNIGINHRSKFDGSHLQHWRPVGGHTPTQLATDKSRETEKPYISRFAKLDFRGGHHGYDTPHSSK